MPNVFLKQFQLHQISRSTRGVRAGAIFGETGDLPNRPLVRNVWWVFTKLLDSAIARLLNPRLPLCESRGLKDRTGDQRVGE